MRIYCDRTGLRDFMSMGNNIVVAKPAKIRKDFIQMAKQVLENYGE